MALKHNKVSSVPDGGDTSVVQPSDWNADHVVDTNGITMDVGTGVPATPAAGKSVLFSRAVGGGALPAFIGPSGLTFSLQPFLARNKISLYSPIGNATAVTQIGIAVSSIGTANARNVTTTNLLNSMRRHAYVSGATAGARAAVYGASQYFLSNAAGMGGFRAIFRFAISDATYVTGSNMFVGMTSTSSVAAGNNVAQTNNIVGVGADTTDTNLQIFVNDGTGTATKIDLGTNFPANTTNTDVYELALFAPSGSASSIGYQVTRLNTGDMATGTLTTDLPAVNQLLLPMLMRGNAAAAAAVGIDIPLFYIETDN